MKKWMTPLLIILFVATLFRTIGLPNRRVNGDEEHYRGNASYALAYLAQGRINELRDHSYHHEWSRSPHGMAYPLISRTVGLIAYRLTMPWAPKYQIHRDNLYSRLCNVLIGIFLVGFIFYFSLKLFGNLGAASMVGLFAALSPIQINWSRGEYLDPMMTMFLGLGFYFSWKALKQIESGGESASKIALYFALSGFMTGNAIGTKWSALMLMPFVPLSVLYAAKKLHCLSARIFQIPFALYFTSLLATFFGWNSWLSIQAVIFADPFDAYGDPGYEVGVLRKMFTNLISCFENHDNRKGFFLLWCGPIFIILVGMWAKKVFETYRTDGFKPDWQSSFLIVFFLSGLLGILVNDGHLYNWRFFYSMTVFFICIAQYFSTFTASQQRNWTVMVVVFTIPFSINHGLRIGHQFPSYFGKESDFFEKSLAIPEYPIYYPPGSTPGP